MLILILLYHGDSDNTVLFI